MGNNNRKSAVRGLTDWRQHFMMLLIITMMAYY